jgi:iron(III)-enterobactin esterase
MFLTAEMTDVTICVDELIIQSEALGREVTCVVYMPDLNQLTGPLNLLIFNDGQDLETMQYDHILQNLYDDELLLPVLTVGIKAGERVQEFGISGKADFKGRGGRASQYRQFVIAELLPAIYAKTGITEFVSTSIAGFSLGALSAFDIAWHHPEIFSQVGAFSGSFWWRSKNINKKKPDANRIAHKLIAERPFKPELRFWFMAGTQEEKSDRNQNGIIDAIDDTTALIKELYKKGYKRETDVQYMELIGGQHNVPTWGSMMPKFLLWAFGK